MSKHLFVRSAVAFSAIGFLVIATAAPVALGAEPVGKSAKLECFSHPDGVNYFALSLKPSAGIEATAPHDVVLLIDTSASQTGDYRRDAIGTLNGVLSDLSPNDRVKLIAVDLNAVPLTEGFVAPGSSETAAAIKKLDTRVPLGATDMEKALTAAADSFQSGSQNARAAIYIGDGMSTACLLGTEKFEKLAKRLLDGRIPVSSSPVGPRVDMQLLGALAMNTGGCVVPMGRNAAGELAAAAAGTVLWPEADVSWPSGFDVYPTRMPPLRGDRDSVVIGTYKGNGPFEIKMTVDGTENLSWTVQGATSNEDNNYLVELVDRAKVDGGVSLPLVGSASLAHAREAVNAGVDQLSRLARQALASGNLDNAQRLAGEALNRDPHNPEALAIHSAVAKKRSGDVDKPAEGPATGDGGQATAGSTPGGDLDLRGDALGIPADAGGFAEAFSHQQRVIAQVIQTQVQNTVNQARKQMGTDPEAATQNLKLTLEMVRQAPDINPEVRDQLVDVIQAALLAASRCKVEVDQKRQQTQENLAQARERILINEGLLHKQEKVRQLMERFDSLMDEGRYRFAEEAAAAEALRIDPDNTTAILAMKYSRIKGHAEKMLEYRIARQKGCVDALASVEKSCIPTPDEPPIIYPDAGVWQELSVRRKEKYSSMDLAGRGTAEKKIDNALKSPTQLEFLETPLQDAIDYLKDYHQIEIQTDSKALDDAGIRLDTPITKNLKGISLRSALRLTLREMDLTYVIKDEVLLITTPEVVDTMLTTKVYPVADLVLPIEDSGFSGGFGGLGGTSGGMGGMMGGGMGGGGMGGGGGAFGGGGMGGGGMGGGGMGGGMFNVPAEIFPQAPVKGFRAFAVTDDLSKNTDQTTEKVEKIQLTVPEGVNPETAWNEYFDTHDPTPTAVRDAVRRLMKDRKFDQVIALVQAALRHRQVQPWMYEVMTLAMEAEGRSKDEIERAAMSAVDFANNSADMMHIGVYLDRLGLHRRALQIYQQVAKLEPVWAEPYVHGLKTARKIDDIDGIRWSTLGILSQAWTEEQADVWKLGLFVANDTLKKLRADKKTMQEAKEFEATLDEAVQRDCVAIVSWTGNADVDLMVEEPSGTICSLRNRRTNAGGVLLGDGCSRLGTEPAKGYREIYVCPKGFGGTYRLLVRRVWGNVTAGKVTVEVITHFRSKNASCIRRKVSLNNDEALVVFDLTDGRRKETLGEHQLANAANAQMAVGRRILAQQLAAAADPAALQSLAMSRHDQYEALPFFRGGAVGYQPVIITLPEGTNLAATAVISADRRYVRITCVPLFSGISEVNVFNMVSGENTEGRGGTGGSGYSGMF